MLTGAVVIGVAAAVFGGHGIYRANQLKTRITARTHTSHKSAPRGSQCIVKLPAAGTRISKHWHSETRVDPPIYIGGSHIKIPIGGSSRKIQVVDQYNITDYPKEIVPAPLTVYPSDSIKWLPPVTEYIGDTKYHTSDSISESFYYYGYSDGTKFITQSVSDQELHLIWTVYEAELGHSRVILWVGIAVLVLVFIVHASA